MAAMCIIGVKQETIACSYDPSRIAIYLAVELNCAYDCRLYLNSLDEFVEEKRRRDKNMEAPDQDPAERIEEEMCEEERYLDMYQDIRKIEEKERIERGKKAEIAFNYDSGSATKVEESSSSEEEIEEPYKMPEGLKLPMGIDLPETMKESAIIEKTAGFVVQKGPQMEIVIKAKQRNNHQQFGFLEFDNRLNAFYKYICKLIREGKYTPIPYISKMRPKPKKLRRLAREKEDEAFQKEEDERQGNKSNALEMIAHQHGSESETDSENSDDDDPGYLHPLLMRTTEERKASFSNGTRDSPVRTYGPMPQPKPATPLPVTTPVPDFNEVLKQHHENIQLENNDNVYSSLFKSLTSLLPNADSKESQAQTHKTQEPESQTKVEIVVETDEEKIQDYAEWHQEFYGRPSPYLPFAHPIPLPPPPDIASSLSIAARYVAVNGPEAEQKLIDHNGDSCEFLFSRSPYYTYYQMRVRYNQWMMSQSYIAAAAQQFASMESSGKESAQASQNASKFPGPPLPPMLEADMSAGLFPTELPTTSQINFTASTGAETEPQLGDPNNAELSLKLERKEKARLFMEKILNEKLASKKRTTKDGQIDHKLHSGKQETQKISDVASIVHTVPPPMLLTEDTLSSLIDRQIQRVFTGSPSQVTAKNEQDTPQESVGDSKKNHEHRSKEKQRRRRRSRSKLKERKRKRSRGYSDDSRASPSSTSDRKDRKKRNRRHRSRTPSTSPRRHRRSRSKSSSMDYRCYRSDSRRRTPRSRSKS
ncbi:surp module domain-containing protein [Ditylenchus destructor]|nr:surp module domain-containing protein [Ditylenchus destructor]